MTATTLMIAAAVAGYLAGSIPFGLLLLRATGGPDPRGIGSGNIGATNVVRAGGKGLGLATLLLDAAKGFVPALLFLQHDARAGAIAGLAAVLGHCFPIWLRFAGGKGVATFLGVSFGLAFPVAPVAFALAWAAIAAATRWVSLASVAGCAAAALASLASPLLPARVGSHAQAGAALLAASLVIAWRHRANFARIRRGEEPRIGQGRVA